jgi:regulator of replication initiation timing
MTDVIDVTREEDEAFEQLAQRLEEAQQTNAELADENWRLRQENERLRGGRAA